MEFDEIRMRAESLGITGLEGKSKGDVIRAIQLAEGNRDCFGNMWRFDCLEVDCCWREDCRVKNPG